MSNIVDVELNLHAIKYLQKIFLYVLIILIIGNIVTVESNLYLKKIFTKK